MANYLGVLTDELTQNLSSSASITAQNLIATNAVSAATATISGALDAANVNATNVNATTGLTAPTPAQGDSSTRAATTAFVGFGSNSAPTAITIGASPFAFTLPSKGEVLVAGGTVTGITITRGGSGPLATGVLAGVFPGSKGDIVTVTYTAVPTSMDFIPL